MSEWKGDRTRTGMEHQLNPTGTHPERGCIAYGEILNGQYVQYRLGRISTGHDSTQVITKSHGDFHVTAEVAASSCLRRAAALAGLGLELWG